MKKSTKITLWIGLLSILFFAAYLMEVERSTQGPGTKGTVIFDKDGDLILVLDSNFDDNDVNLPINELLTKYKDVGRVSLEGTASKHNLKNGQKVTVWVSGADESNPPTYKIIKIK